MDTSWFVYYNSLSSKVSRLILQEHNHLPTVLFIYCLSAKYILLCTEHVRTFITKHAVDFSNISTHNNLFFTAAKTDKANMFSISRKSCVMEETVGWTQDATVISAQTLQYQHVK